MESQRIVIAGGPRTGKTTLSESFAIPVHHTDDLISLGWSEASEAVAKWFDEPGPWVVEGVAAPRALRKWLAANPTGKPCDCVRWLDTRFEELKPGQVSMFKGCVKVFDEIKEELSTRGVEIVGFNPVPFYQT